MLRTLEYMCVVGSIALIGADRIDLLAGHGSFRLTPFLFLASLVVLIQILRAKLQFEISPPLRRQIPFFILLVLFLFLSFTSTVFGLNPERGLVALADLVLVSVLGYCISVRVVEDPAPGKLILRSVTFALIVWLVFCIGGLIAWSQGLIRLDQEGSSSIASTFAPTAAFFFAPRLSGSCLDPNRAGFILVMYLALLDRFVAKTRYTGFLCFAIGLFILLALSRSAMLCWLGYYLFSSAFWQQLLTRRSALKVATFALVCSLVGFVYRNDISELLELWKVSDALYDRLSVEQGTSGGDHVQLIKRGFETWSTSAHTVVTGIGLASAPKVLGDFFGDDKYGNFHSLYVTVLAELGLPAFLLILILLGYPIIGRKGALPTIAAIAIFNIPYQSHMEPVFWVVLALLWSFELKGTRSRQPSLTRTSVAVS